MQTTQTEENQWIELDSTQQQQILRQAEALMLAMQGKGDLQDLIKVFGKPASLKKSAISFYSNRNGNRSYDEPTIRIWNMAQEEFEKNPNNVTSYLGEASFNFKKVKGLSHQELVEKLKLTGERYDGFVPTTAPISTQTRRYYYSYKIDKKQSKAPYTVDVTLVYLDEPVLLTTGKQHIPNQIHSINITRSRY